MMRSAVLECFDTVTEPETDTAFQSGYDAGFAAAQDQIEADQSRLRAEVAQSIADLEYTFAEAHAAVIHSLGPLMSEIAKTVFPGLIDTSFHAHLTEVLTQAANKHAVQEFSLSVHPAQADAVKKALHQLDHRVSITSEPNVPEHSAWISHAQGEAQVDVAAVLEALQEVLKAIPTTTTAQEVL